MDFEEILIGYFLPIMLCSPVNLKLWHARTPATGDNTYKAEEGEVEIRQFTI